MNKTLVKFKNVNDIGDLDYIKAIYPYNVIETIRLLKLSDSIRVNDDYYVYHSNEFEPADGVGMLDMVTVYVEG